MTGHIEQQGRRTQVNPHSVSEPSSYIIGGPDLFVDVGSMVNISCVVLNTDKPPDTVKWLHGGEEISFRGPRNGVSVRDTFLSVLITSQN